MILHPIPPVYDATSRILILGSFPSVRSREEQFFYGHKQNRFWQVTAAVFDAPVPKTVAEKRAFLLQNGIAVWDVIGACDIVGSADSTIKNVTANDISVILRAAKIERIFTNGKAAKAYYDRYVLPAVGREATALPSTSPANAAWSAERLTEAWSAIRIPSKTNSI